MSSAEDSLQFAQQCQKIIDQGRSDFIDSAQLMYDIHVPSGARLHPMLQEASILLEYIVDDFEADETNEERWETIVHTIRAYLAGQWAPSCWRLVAIYGIKEQTKLVHTFTLVVTRQNGKLKFESGNKKLLLIAKGIALKLDKLQTDEWFVKNLRYLLPDNADDSLNLQSAVVIEQLIEQLRPPHTSQLR